MWEKQGKGVHGKNNKKEKKKKKEERKGKTKEETNWEENKKQLKNYAVAKLRIKACLVVPLQCPIVVLSSAKLANLTLGLDRSLKHQ